MADRIAELNLLIDRKYEDLKEEVAWLPDSYRVHPIPFSDWEAEWVLRGISEGLFNLGVRDGSKGYRELHFAGDVVRNRDGGPMAMHFFWRWKGGDGFVVGVWREAFTEIAAVSYLVLGLGCDRERVRLESDDWALDLLVHDRPWRKEGAVPVVCSEVKTTSDEVDRMVDGMDGCRGVGDKATHVSAGARASEACNHHKKCAGLLKERAPLFWAVSPDPHRHRHHAVEYEATSFSLSPDVGEDALRATVRGPGADGT